MPDLARKAKKELEAFSQQAIDSFETYLRKQNLKMTQERRDIVRAVYKRTDHFSVDDLLEDLQNTSQRGSRATLYRTLDLMAKCGLVDRHVFLDGKSIYEAALGNPHHDHIMCLDCERLIEFHDEEIELQQDRICHGFGLKMVDHVHKLYAQCTRDNCEYRTGSA